MLYILCSSASERHLVKRNIITIIYVRIAVTGYVTAGSVGATNNHHSGNKFQPLTLGGTVLKSLLATEGVLMSLEKQYKTRNKY